MYGRIGEIAATTQIQRDLRAIRGVHSVTVDHEDDIVVLSVVSDGSESMGYVRQKALNLGFGTERPKPDPRIISSMARSEVVPTTASISTQPLVLRALVVGNSRYAHVAPLRNPANDARAMALSLKNLGYQVRLELDIETSAAMRRCVQEAFPQTSVSCVSLFFYAGHGVQANGSNYLVPVGAQLTKESDAASECLDLDAILAELPGGQDQTNLVILDACRNNPFIGTTRSAARGLAPISRSPTGTLIAYSTAPGMTAADGDGEYGLYTSELLAALRTQDRPIEELFKTVRVGVRRKSNGQQVPWELSSIEGALILNPSHK